MDEVYCATFIFKKGNFNEEFHRLDKLIADFARATQGYIGEESYENAENGQIINLYYWNDPAGLRALMQNQDHRQAKQQQARWLNGYQVIVSKVLAAYNNGKFVHPLQSVGLRSAILPRVGGETG